MDHLIDILQVAKCFAAEERNKAEQAKKILEANNAKYLDTFNNIKNSLLNNVTKLHGQHTPHGPIDVLVQDQSDTFAFISIGGRRFCRLDAYFCRDGSEKEKYTGIIYSATFWSISSNCDRNCGPAGWFSLSHTDGCKVRSVPYYNLEYVPSLLEMVGYNLSKWLL